jgi:hypothetical protein
MLTAGQGGGKSTDPADQPVKVGAIKKDAAHGLYKPGTLRLLKCKTEWRSCAGSY